MLAWTIEGRSIVLSRDAALALAQLGYDLHSDRDVDGRPLSRLAAAHAAARAAREPGT